MTVELAPTWVIGSVDLTEYPFSVDRDNTVNIGEPEMVVEGTPSLLADGDLERVVRHGNRDYSIDFYIEGPTLGDLAQSEALLRAELRRDGLELTHNPGDAFAATSVYEVHTAALAPTRNDTHEGHLIRRYTLTLRCSPFARSLAAVTVEALPVGTSSVSVDTCDSTTGWAAGILDTGGDTLSVVSGAVRVTDASGGNDRMSLYRAASIDVSVHPHLVIEWMATPGPGYMIMGMPAAANQFPAELYRVALPDAGWFRSAWLVAPGDLASGFQFSYVNTTGTSPGDWLSIRDVSKSDIPPGVTNRQLTRIIDTGGTERTPASIHLYSGYDLADTQSIVVHTSPEDGSGYSPPLRRWKVAGNTATSAEGDTLSLFSEPLKPDASTCEVPNTTLPAGGYVLAARLRASVATLVGLDWAVHSFFPDAVDPEEGAVFGSAPWVPKVASEWEIVPLAVLTLPTVRGVGGKTRVSVFCGALDSDVFWDEMWLFRVDDDCALTIVENHPPDHLWLDSANSQSPVPTVWQGWASDRSDARHPGRGLISWDNHVLHPDGTAVFSAAVTNDLRVEASFHRRWHSNAAE